MITRTFSQMADDLGIAHCAGGCGITDRSHAAGFIFLEVLHFAERRFTKRGAKRFLMLCAKIRRGQDEGYLNVPERYGWLYQHVDSVAAQDMAGHLGFRLPARLFDPEREHCKLLARKAGVKLSQHTAVYSWLQR